MEQDEVEINDLRDQLIDVLDEVRQHQLVVASGLPSNCLAHCKGMNVEDFTLGLPSDFSAAQCIQYGLSDLAEHEGRLREAQITNTITSLKSTVNRLIALLTYKERNVDAEKLRTRTGKAIQKVLLSRDVEVKAYNDYRQLLINLGIVDNASVLYPLLTPNDTFKKDVNGKTRAGDSKRREGILWTMRTSERSTVAELGCDLPVGVGEPVNTIEYLTATRFVKRKARTIVPEALASSQPSHQIREKEIQGALNSLYSIISQQIQFRTSEMLWASVVTWEPSKLWSAV